MRKERLIVPVLAVLALAWAVAQTLAGLLFERELARVVAELRQGGELSVRRSDVERGWLTSHGVIHLAPLFGNAWHLDLVYRARHGVLETRLDGTLRPHAPEIEPDHGAVSATPPRWDAHFRPYSSTLDATLELAPVVFRQQDRTLTLQGGRVAVHGDVGDWRLRARLAELHLDDGESRLSAGPLVLESRFAYTRDVFHFNQHDHLRIQNLAWRSPELAFDAEQLGLTARTVLDAEELRLKARLDVGEVLSGDEVLLTGELAGELSRLDADALRAQLPRAPRAVGRKGLIASFAERAGARVPSVWGEVPVGEWSVADAAWAASHSPRAAMASSAACRPESCATASSDRSTRRRPRKRASASSSPSKSRRAAA